MKMIKTLLILCLFYVNAYSQVITTIPAHPTENDSIIIIFDATKTGGEELLNYTGILYAHTGVNTNSGTWQHVIESWGNNQTQPALVRLEANKYQLTIGYPRQFYGLTDNSEHIQQIALVVRSAEATKQSRPDFFIDIYQSGLSVIVNSPKVSTPFGDPLRSPAFANLQDTIDVKISTAAIGTKLSSLTLFINNVQKAQTSVDSLSYKFIAAENNPGSNNIEVIGVDTSGNADTTSFYIFVNSAVVIASQPSGVEYGINYISDNSVVLELYAPDKKFVYVLGDFNNWEVNPAYYMKRTPDQSKYWIQIDGLEAGKEYIFQYLVDGNIRIADPYADKISDPSNDSYINSATYPGLISYPAGKTSEIASVLQTAQQPYHWQESDFERPEKQDLVIYELLLRDFLTEHNYSKLIDTLSYLKTLGVNAIELMPVMEFEGNESWGYNVSFHFAPDKYYGTKNELKRFVEEAHKKGIAVILDIVLNHMYGQSPLVRLYWNSALNRPAANNPWFNEVSPNSTYSFGYDFNHDRSATKLYVDRVNKYWIDEYHVDGYRFDFTKGFTNTPGDGSGFDQSRINILERMASQIWTVDSSAYVILEHFAPDNEEIVLSNYGMMLWGNLNYNYGEASMGWVSTSDFSRISYKQRGWQKPYLVGYMESHDEEREMYRNLQFGNSNGSYSVKNLETALQRIKMAAAFYFTIPGPKMIWQFGELGYDVTIDFNGRVGNKPVKWNYYNEPARKKLYKTFAALTALKQYKAFESSNFTLTAAGSVKRLSIIDSTMDVYVLGNFDVTAKTVNNSFPKKGYWYNYFTGDSVDVTDSVASVTLAPGEFYVYTTAKLPAVDPDIITGLENSENADAGIPVQFELSQNYPNPFNPSTTINYRVPEGSLVTLKIYDVLGNEISTLVNEDRPAGVYEVKFDASALSSGVYFYRLDAGSFRETKKMILLR